MGGSFLVGYRSSSIFLDGEGVKAFLVFLGVYRNNSRYRAGHTDFGKGGDLSPPIGGGPKGGDKGPMGGDWRVIRD